MQGSTDDITDTISKLISSNILGDETVMQPEEQGAVLIMNAFDKTISLSTYNLTDDLQWLSYANYKLEPVQVVEACARAGFSGGFCEGFNVHIFTEHGQQLSTGLGVRVTSGNTYEYRGGKGLFCVSSGGRRVPPTPASTVGPVGSGSSGSSGLSNSGRSLGSSGRIGGEVEGDAGRGSVDEVEVTRRKRRSRGGRQSGEFTLKPFDEV